MKIIIDEGKDTELVLQSMKQTTVILWKRGISLPQICDWVIGVLEKITSPDVNMIDATQIMTNSHKEVADTTVRVLWKHWQA